jgi:hypothetical protein
MFFGVSTAPGFGLSSWDRGVLYLCLASISLNLVLFAFLLRAKQPRVSPSDSRVTPSELKQRPPADKELVPPLSSTPTNPIPTFTWAEVEAADYRQYVANLKAIGCPEETIRDIVVADIAGHYAPRVAAIWKPQFRAYWQKQIQDQPGPAEMKELMALGKEKESVLKELLGRPVRDQELIDCLYLQLHGPEQELLFLPEDKQQAALQALRESGFEEKREKLQMEDSYWERQEEMFKEQLKALATVLSPSELAEFRLRASPSAQSLRVEVQYFNCTPEEFKLLLDGREDQKEEIAMGDLINRLPATKQVRTLFGEERAAEFERVTDMIYINARRALEDNNLPIEAADRAWQVWHEARMQSEKVAGNETLSLEERRSQLQALREGAEARITEVLGEVGSKGVRRDVRLMLNNYAMRLGK